MVEFLKLFCMDNKVTIEHYLSFFLQPFFLDLVVAVKVLTPENLHVEGSWEAFLTKFRKEIGIMSRCAHPNIMLYMGASTSVPGKLMIVTERLSIDLESLLVKDGPKKMEMSTTQILSMAK